jgi:DHA2 family multidrug resistance protein-like MFS transporter
MGAAGTAKGPVPPSRGTRPSREIDKPARAGAILTVLILGAVVANINLAIANVALPSIGAALATSQAELNLVAVGFTLGLAASVLYLGALADRYGRKPAMMLGAALSIPTSLLAAWAPNATVLIAARVSGGMAAGLLYPITLSLITGLFRGGARIRAIALWSGIGGGCSALGPLIGGLLLGQFWWGSVFLPSVPIAALVVVLAGLWLPRHAGETSEPVDHLGGGLSVASIGPLVLAISLVPNYGFNGTVLGLFAVSLVGLVLFVVRERRAPSPLFDLNVLRARTFTIALIGGTITWGGLLGATFIGQQYTQNVLGYSPLSAALTTLPAAVFVAAAARPAGRLITSRGSRIPLALGLAVTAAGFLGMAVLFGTAASALVVGIVYGVLGLGIGLAGPPSSSSLMGSVPVARAGMGSASNDLQRDFGGALFQAVMGTPAGGGVHPLLHQGVRRPPPTAGPAAVPAGGGDHQPVVHRRRAGRQAVPPGPGTAARRRRPAGIRRRQDGRHPVRRDRMPDRPGRGLVPLPEQARRGGDLRPGGRPAATPTAQRDARARPRRPGRRTRRTPLTGPPAGGIDDVVRLRPDGGAPVALRPLR